MSPQHARHYSPEEANAALPRVRELLRTLRAASERLGDREAREALGEAAPGNGGGEPGRTVSEAFIELREAMAELQEGEPEIAFWHEPEAGIAGRRPLENG